MINCSFMKIGKMSDKACHFIVGFAIVFILSFIIDPGLAVILGTFSGFTKELIDYVSYGKFDFFDMFATIVGSVIGLFAYGILIELMY